MSAVQANGLLRLFNRLPPSQARPKPYPAPAASALHSKFLSADPSRSERPTLKRPSDRPLSGAAKAPRSAPSEGSVPPPGSLFRSQQGPDSMQTQHISNPSSHGPPGGFLVHQQLPDPSQGVNPNSQDPHMRPFLPIPPTMQEPGRMPQQAELHMPQQPLMQPPHTHQPQGFPDQLFEGPGPHHPQAGLQDLNDYQAASHVAENLHLLDPTALTFSQGPQGPMASLPMPGSYPQLHQAPPMHSSGLAAGLPHSQPPLPMEEPPPYATYEPEPLEHFHGSHVPRSSPAQQQGMLPLPGHPPPGSLAPHPHLSQHSHPQAAQLRPQKQANPQQLRAPVSTAPSHGMQHAVPAGRQQAPPPAGQQQGRGLAQIPHSAQSVLLEHLPQDLTPEGLVAFLDGPGGARGQYDVLRLFPARSAQPMNSALLHFRQPGQAAGLWGFLKGRTWDALTGVESHAGASGAAAMTLAPGTTIQQLLGSVWARGQVREFEGPPGAYSIPPGDTCLYYSDTAVHPAELARPDTLQAEPFQGLPGPQPGRSGPPRASKHAPIVYQRTPGGMQVSRPPSQTPSVQADKQRWVRQDPSPQTQAQGLSPPSPGVRMNGMGLSSAGPVGARQPQAQGHLEQAVMSVLTGNGAASQAGAFGGAVQGNGGMQGGPPGLGGSYGRYSDSPRHSADFGDDFLAL